MNLQPNILQLQKKHESAKFTALYLRLSKDDENIGESDSIINQRILLVKYARDNGFNNILEFVDDGWSGIDFQRPQFQRMITMVENGEIERVIVKDLSRMGREYIQMGMFTEIVFPKYNIHFIAINDLVDSKKGENDFTALKFLFNEWHVRDTSRKVRAIKDMQAQRGERVNGHITPFGYKYNGEKLIVDSQKAPIVKRIFALCASGLGPAQIARKLTEEKVVTPYGYKGYSTGKPVSYPDRWSETTIGKMLERKEYIGHTVNKKSYVLSYKQKKRMFNDEANTLIFYNTHEAIVDEQTFEIVQKIRKNKKRTTKMGEQPIFSGLVYCADCGKSEYIFRGTTFDESQYTYNCGTYRGKSRGCTPHGIRVVVMEKMILEHIQKVVKYAVSKEKQFINLLLKNSQQIRQDLLRHQNDEMEKARTRAKEIDNLFIKIYEDKHLGVITDERFTKMSTSYESEQEELNRFIAVTEKELFEKVDVISNIEKFLKVARRHEQIKKLDGTSLRELIDKIIVHEKVKEGNKTISQQIDIYFQYVGMILI